MDNTQTPASTVSQQDTQQKTQFQNEKSEFNQSIKPKETDLKKVEQLEVLDI